ILYSNRHFASLIERPLEQIVGRPLSEFIAPRDAEALQGLLDDGARWSVRRELTVQGRNGVIPTLVAASPLVDADASAVLMIVTDLTAQKHSEEIAAAEQFARSILEQATDAVLVCNRSGRITHASWAAERLLGQPVIGQLASHALRLHVDAPDAAGGQAASV